MKRIVALVVFLIMVGSVAAHAENVAAGSNVENNQAGKAISGFFHLVTMPLSIFKKAGDEMQPEGTGLSAKELAAREPYNLDAETTG